MFAPNPRSIETFENSEGVSSSDLLQRIQSRISKASSKYPVDSKEKNEETAEIVALQCHAWLKLRRYTDLGQEIEKWNFVPFNENYDESQASRWVPWSLRKPDANL